MCGVGGDAAFTAITVATYSTLYSVCCTASGRRKRAAEKKAGLLAAGNAEVECKA